MTSYAVALSILVFNSSINLVYCSTLFSTEDISGNYFSISSGVLSINISL